MDENPFGPPGLAEILARGDRRESLVALRDHLARQLESCRRADAIAPIARQLNAVLTEIDNIPDPGEESELDEITARRNERRAAAKRRAADQDGAQVQLDGRS